MGASARYFTTWQVARLFGVSLPTVASWTDRGLLRAHRTPGGHRRIARNDLLAFARSRGGPIPTELLETDGAAPRVLVIDDEVDFAELVREYLTVKGGLDVQVAHTGFEAGYAVASFRPDVILLDLMMPDLDGFELRRLLLDNPSTHHVPVVACSAYRERDVDLRLREERFSAFVEKPVKLDNLLDILREQLGVLDE